MAKRGARSVKVQVRLNGEAVSDPMLVIDVGGAPVKLSLGKKKHGLLTRS
jgi:hypothetical protein